MPIPTHSQHNTSDWLVCVRAAPFPGNTTSRRRWQTLRTEQSSSVHPRIRSPGSTIAFHRGRNTVDRAAKCCVWSGEHKQRRNWEGYSWHLHFDTSWWHGMAHVSCNMLTVQPEGISSRKCRYVGVRCPCVGIIPRPKRCSASIPRNSSEADQVTRSATRAG